MKLKTFNATNVLPKKFQGQTPVIAFERRSGLFRINKNACVLMALQEGNKIEFTEDVDKPGSWYINLNNQNGFELRAKNNVTSGLYFNSSTLAQLLMNSVKYKGQTAKVFIKKVSVYYRKKKLWPLDLSPLKAQS